MQSNWLKRINESSKQPLLRPIHHTLTQSSCAVKEMPSKDAEAANGTGFHRTIASLPLTSMATS